MPHFNDNPEIPLRLSEDAATPLMSQIARFAVVGVINTAVDLAVLNALIALSQRGRTGLLYSFFKGISFLGTVLNSYWLNSRWAFRQTATQNTSMRIGRFLSVSVLALAINVGTASWVAVFTEPVRRLARWWPSVAALAGAACGLAFNFAGYKYLVFFTRRTVRIGLCSDAHSESGDRSVPSIDDGLEQIGQRPLRTVGRTQARDRAGTILPNETHQPPARSRTG